MGQLHGLAAVPRAAHHRDAGLDAEQHGDALADGLLVVDMVTDAGRAALHRCTKAPGGAHTDGLVTLDQEHVRPMLGDFTAALSELEVWTRPTSAGRRPYAAG